MSKQRNNDQTQTHRVLENGSVVGHYTIVRPIGAGGMGEVYLADDTSLDRRVALKFMPTRLASDPVLKNRFNREARAAAGLNHPCVVTIHEVGEHDGRPFYAMEFIDGQSLSDRLREDDLPIDETLRLMVQVCEGLATAHAKGVVHRDIKPANIVVDENGRPRLVDFGLAAMEGEETVTSPGTRLGTLAYMSPEQVRGEPIDHRSDLFSFGCVLYELITSQAPFRQSNDAATMRAILENDVDSLHTHRPDAPPELQAVVDKLLNKDPALRYPDARDLLSDLRDITRHFEQEPDEEGDDAPSIAVLPFANMSTDPEQEHFCDGIAEDIINDLTQIEEIRVVARTSAFAFKGKNDDIRDIGRRLNVDTVLEGSVRKAGNRIRLTAQLINVADGYHIWSERYDRELSDIFAIQDDIARAIVEKLVGELVGTSPAQPGRQQNVEAYELYSKGRYHLNLRTRAGFNEALTHFESALEIDPNYMLARAGMADAYFLMAAYDYMELREATSRARINALEVLDVNDSVAEAHTTLAGIYTYFDWAWKDAEEAFKRALEINPGYVAAHLWYGEMLSMLDRQDDADREMQRALELDPLSTIVLTMAGWHYYLSGRAERGIEYLQKAVDLGTTNDTTYIMLAYALHELGRTDEARGQFARAREHSENAPYSLAMSGHFHALLGETDETLRYLNELHMKAQREFVPPAYFAILYLDLGEEANAWPWFADALRIHDSELLYMAVLPFHANIRSHERIRRGLGILGLPVR